MNAKCGSHYSQGKNKLQQESNFMMEYSSFPPCPYFMQILRHSPDAAILYCKLWGSKNIHYKIGIKKNDIFNIYLISPTIFRNRLVKLMEEGLLSFETTPEMYYIELVAFDNMEEEEDDDDYEFS